MKTYQIETAPNYFETARASYAVFEGGSLILLDEDKNLLIAYGSGRWLSVCPAAV